jgi:hypothetical protein
LGEWYASNTKFLTGSLLADHIKEDPSFHPRSSHLTSRWHVHAAGHDWEFLCTGPKFLDIRMDRGGGGAIDFVVVK